MQRSFYEVDTIEAPWNSGVDTEEDGTPNIGFKNRIKERLLPGSAVRPLRRTCATTWSPTCRRSA